MVLLSTEAKKTKETASEACFDAFYIEWSNFGDSIWGEIIYGDVLFG